VEGHEVYSFVTEKNALGGKDEKRKDRHYRCSHALTHYAADVRRAVFLSLTRTLGRGAGRKKREPESRSSGTEDAYNRQWTTAPQPLSRGLTWTPA